MRGSLVFLLDGAIPSCSESGSRQGLCWGRHACHHTCALGLLCFLLCPGHIAWCPGVKLAPANLVGPKEGMEIKGLKGSYFTGLLGSQMRQRQHGSHQVHPCLGHGSWADTGGALSEHRAFLGSLLLLRGVIGLLGSWNLSDKGQEQTLGASIPPCSIPGAPGASVSGDFSASLFLDPTGSLVGDRRSLSPYCLSKSQASHQNLASVAHQALMSAGPAFPWDTARRPLPVSSPPLCMAWCFSLSVCLSPHCCFLCTCQGPTRR